MQGRLKSFLTAVSVSVLHSGLATLAFSRASRDFLVNARSVFDNGGETAGDIWLASLACSLLLIVLSAFCTFSPLLLYRFTRRLILRLTTCTLFTAACALALTRVVLTPASDDWFWAGTVLLFTAAAGEAFLCDSLLGRVYGWAAEDAARKLGVKVETEKPQPTDPSTAEAAEAAAKARANTRASVTRLLALSKPDWRFLLFAFSALTIAAVGQTLVPGYVGSCVDAISNKDLPGMRRQILNLVLVSAGTAIFTGARGAAFTVAIARLKVRLRDRLFRSLLQQEQGFMDANSSGQLLSRLSSDTTAVGDQISLNVSAAAEPERVPAVDPPAWLFSS